MNDDTKKQNGEGRKFVSPYILTANDNPGNIITQVQLKGDNYDEWVRAVRTALRAKKKCGFIDGTVKQPDEDSPDLEDWWTVNSMVVSWILNTIEPTLRSTITYMEIAKDLWEDIRERFSIANEPRVQQIKGELAEWKQRGLPIVTYYGRLKQLWEELANYDQIPTCQCGRCTCNLSVQFDKKREEEKLHQFLLGLDDTMYGTIRSNILSTEPLPSVSKAYSLICQEERVRNMSKEKEGRGEPMSFAIHANTGGRRPGTGTKDKPVLCSYCNRGGHDAESCFQLIGYPDWWGDRPKGIGRGSGRGRGNQNSGRGRGSAPRANSAQMVGQSSLSPKAAEGEHAAHGLMSSDQWAAFLSLLNSCKSGTNEKLSGKNSLNWIIDSGASHHMTGSLACMTDLKELLGCAVGLPDGNQTMALKEGLVRLGEHIKLKNAFYVPNLNCNLISVSQLLDELDCFILFTKKIMRYTGPCFEDGDWSG